MLTAADVAHSRFKATKFTEGYDQEAVDDFLDRVVATLRASETGAPADRPLTAADVRDVTFPTTKLREGYAKEEVDELLERVREALGHTPAGTASVTPPPPPAGTAPDPSSTPGLLEPRRGWLRRLLGG